ncbi:MAG TPA: hemerythrin domain-containing protein [Ramlibacter sp.]|uniref:bacteriohemerythrin n=1 Tax=Ramlibacter sp. TaxID=1917967 RepID=UPI002D7F83B3|nr:hemerythrin domain-containing protein [Ramlibacter sp.]HET8747373.1 hemerythrin domain-containing protein [Ramlibacter sp.]
MPALPWTDGLKLGLPIMDTTHQEFVDLLARAEAADDASLPALWNELVEHTTEHFAGEDEWMLATGFALGNAHTTQHKAVLRVLRHGAAEAARGNLAPIRKVVRELAVWFPHHAQTMDASLALHLQGVGYDPTTGRASRPENLPTQALSGCGDDA